MLTLYPYVVAELQSRAYRFAWNRRAPLMPWSHPGTIDNSCDRDNRIISMTDLRLSYAEALQPFSVACGIVFGAPKL